MKKNLILIGITLLILIGLIFAIAPKRENQSVGEPETPISGKDPILPDTVATATAPTQTSINESESETTAAPRKLQKLQLPKPPTRAEVREEVRDNPHSTPASLVRFAQDTAEVLEQLKASKDPIQFTRLAKALRQCAGVPSPAGQSLPDADYPPQIEVFCFQTLEEIFNDLSEVAGQAGESFDAESTLNGLRPETQRLLKASELLNSRLNP